VFTAVTKRNADFVVLVRTEVSEKLIASIIRIKRISELATTLVVTSN
jgi:hypothetical protein